MAMILYGINNIYKVSHDGREIDCVLKGKILKGTGRSYAPLAPGDSVEIEISKSGLSRIVSRVERSTEFSRWNKKRKAPQTLAANADLVVCICSPESPPFRPRLVDRVHVTCEIERITLMVVLNKSDQKITREIEERLEVYTSAGCDVVT